MMNEVNRIARRYEQLGIALPDAAQDAIATYHAARAAFTNNDTAFTEDLRAGKITAKTIAKRMYDIALPAVAHEYMARFMPDVDQAMTAQANRALIADIPHLIDTLRPTYLEATAPLVDAAALIGPHDYTDPALVIARGPQASAAYHAAEHATPTLELIRRLLVDLTVRDMGALAVSLFIDLDDNAPPTTLDIATDTFAKNPRWIGLFAIQGVSPKLNSIEDADALIARTRTHELKATVTA